MRIYDRMQTHGIVKSCLNVSGSSWRCTVKITDTDGNGLCAALKVRANRCGQNTELIFICRLYSDHRVAAKHIRTHIKRCSASIRRHISFICLNSLYDGFHKFILGINGHFQTSCTLLHSLAV